MITDKNLIIRTRAARRLLVGTALCIAALSGCAEEPAAPQNTALEDGFISPPNSAKPRVWWHWMNGNVTKDGIQKDLDWMSRMGIGGVQNFDAELMTPQIVDKRIVYMTPEWSDMFKFALSEAKKHDFEFAIAASPGWSETGGPWVEPKDGMKKLVWSETIVEAGAEGIVLPKPPMTTGPFQDFPLPGELFGAPKPESVHPHWYEDIAVLAVPATGQQAPIQVTGPDGRVLDAANMLDGSYKTSAAFKTAVGIAYSLRFDFDGVKEFRSASLALPPAAMFSPANFAPVLEASTDGENFVKVADFLAGTGIQSTASFPAVKAKALRIVFEPNSVGFKMPSSSAPGAVAFKIPQAEGVEVNVLETAFYSDARVHMFEEKAGYAIAREYYPLNTSADVQGVPAGAVIDLTDKMQADGRLDWTPKAGTWRIIRLGTSLTGKENHPAPAEATGLEVDKYDAAAVRRYINTYLDKYKAAVGESMSAAGIAAVLNDSIESGASNWTPTMAAEFKRRRGYDLAPWLPALTGTLVESAAKTDAFLYDYRKTLGELLADNHYKVITEELHKRGLMHYSEALENGRPVLGDGMEMRKNADIPMAAMWSFDTANNVGPMAQYWSDIREAASVAHIYGQNLVAAESLTSAASPWAFSPADLKPMIDMEFALGVNRPIIHTSVHQPLTDKAPGLSLFVFGQYFNRLETWAEYAKPWVTYISRNAYMLQQGRFAADVAYFYGEESPLTALYNDAPPMDVPSQNGFDYINADVILHELENDGSAVTTASGARYKVIYLGGTSQYMTLPVLEKLAALVRGGAVLVGEKPLASPSLADDAAAFKVLADSLWSGAVGGGKVLVETDIQTALDTLNIAPDFSYNSDHADTTIMFVHRTLPDADIYFYTNRKPRAEALDLRFRVTGKKPMHWDAATGAMTAVSYRMENGVTVVPRTLAAHEAGYIVFTDDTDATAFEAETPAARSALDVTGDWAVSFQAGRGAPDGVHPLPLGNFAVSDDKGIKYFSGTATYTKEITISEEMLASGDSIALDLGTVADVAEVFVNGTSAGILWTAPYTADITEHAKAGVNTVEVKVTNLWVNRLIGDLQPGASEKVTFTVLPTYVPDAPLRPSGLLGPVALVQTSEKIH